MRDAYSLRSYQNYHWEARIARYFLSTLVSTHLLLDKKHTILSSTVNLLDKIDYLPEFDTYLY